MSNISVIKWSGSKRLIAEKIVSYFPKKCDIYFEPFLGGGSVLLQYLPNKAICCDINESLIDFWNIVKNNPNNLIKSYSYNWDSLQKNYKHFFKIRDRYNKTKKGDDLFFLSRTCVNGLIRYNKSGMFNNSLHYTRKGASPDKIAKIIKETSSKIKNYKFVCCDYEKILNSITPNSFIYLDPPYYYTKSMYYGKIDYNNFWIFLKKLKKLNVKFALSFDGTTNKREYSVKIPRGIFKRHILIKSGKSTFNKVIDKVQNDVFESLYLSW